MLMIDCFITHVWRQSEQWVTFENFLYNDKLIKWRNFSLPWHDPALKSWIWIRTEIGNEEFNKSNFTN